MSVDLVSALARALSFIALFQAAGVAMFIAIFGSRLERAAGRIRALGLGSAVAGSVAVGVHYALEAGRMAGALSGVFDPFLQRLVLDSPMSTAWGLRTAGLATIAMGISLKSNRAIAVALAGVLLAIVAFVFVGHTAAAPDRGWLAVLLAAHLSIVAFWFGGLAPLHVVSRRETPEVAAAVVERFSRIAIWLVPGIFLAGVLLTLSLVDRWAVFGEGYGLLLLAKVAGFALLMGLAALNKWRYGPALATTPASAVAFRRSVLAEYLLICAVLTATAFMTTFFSP